MCRWLQITTQLVVDRVQLVTCHVIKPINHITWCTNARKSHHDIGRGTKITDTCVQRNTQNLSKLSDIAKPWERSTKKFFPENCQWETFVIFNYDEFGFASDRLYKSDNQIKITKSSVKTTRYNGQKMSVQGIGSSYVQINAINLSYHL